MPYYFFQKNEKSTAPSFSIIEECGENEHQEAAEKEQAYNQATLERGEPVVRRVYAKSSVEAKAIIEEYGPKLAPPSSD